MENRLKRYKRYVRYLSQWLFLEKLGGLDFSMRDTSLIAATGGIFHGYSKTDESHAKEIFQSLNVDGTKRLLDIGCGKGAFLKEAAKWPFGAIAGIEYVEKLADIAKKNFKKLGLDDRVKVYRGDAVTFEHYGDYNVFYFFNPFDPEMLDKVMERMVNAQKEKIWVVLHNPVAADVVEKHGGVETVRLYDPVKSYETRIYEIEKA